MGRFAGRNDHPRGGTKFHGFYGEVQVAETRRNGEVEKFAHRSSLKHFFGQVSDPRKAERN